MDELATATTNVGRLTAQLTAANNNVESLTDRIGTADDADSLQGMLAAEKARVTTLMNQIGTAPGGDDTGGSGLRKDLADAEANVARLTAQIGTAEDADSLQGMLKAEKDEVTRLTTLIGAEANEANAVGSLYAQLKYAKAEVMRLTGEIGTASDSDSLKGMLEAEKLEVIRLKSQVITLNERITGLQSQLADASTDVTDAEQRADQAEREADQRVAEIERQGDTNTQGRGLLAALELVLNDAGTTWAPPDDTAMVDNNDRDTDIEITASPLTGSTRKSGNFYTATLTYTAPGVSQPEHKTVVYTDREKSRSFANHYLQYIDGGTKAKPRFVNNAWTDELLAKSEIISRLPRRPGGHPESIAADGNNPADPKPVDKFSATVHGVSGQYGCAVDSGTCKVNVAVTYAQPDGAAMNARKVLNEITISPSTNDGTLYFEPSNAHSVTQISLLGVAKTGTSAAPAATDQQYITFGWWQERPGLADGTYQAAVFADRTPNGVYTGATGSAVYQGPAVGLYVDRTSEGGKTVHESGDFTATAVLRADFGETNPVSGDVTNFQTPHGAKNWHVKLNDDLNDDNNNTAEIVQTDTSSTGTWEHKLLARHANALPANVADDQPIAVTGRFDVSIPNVRHIVGAFGAHRTTGPIGQ